jgi:glycosyltransferase domain-containing protein
MDVTLFIPTMNRPDLLFRLIDYYDSLRFNGKIIIGDSSITEVFIKTASTLRYYVDRLDIEHYHFPGLRQGAAVLEMNKFLTTSYACLLGDDDFIIPTTINNCIEFLENNNDYIAVNGSGVCIASSSGDSSHISTASFYCQTIMEEVNASDRLLKHFENYSVSLFSVFRSEIWLKMFNNIPLPSELPQCCDNSFASELLPCCLSVVYGKIKQIDGLYLIRQVHDNRYLLPTWYSWITNEIWYSSYMYFRNQLAKAISIKDQISFVKAEDIVDLAFSIYLAKIIPNSTIKSNWLIDNIRKNPVLSRVIRNIRDLLYSKITSRGKISLSSLTNPSSPYYKDFVPVFNMVTGKSK